VKQQESLSVTRSGKPTVISNDFRNRADSAAFFEAWVGAVLARAGLYTVHHPFTLAKSKEDIGNYAQTFDIEVAPAHPLDSYYNERGYVGTEVEVKSVNLTFNNPLDYPFDDLLVCSQSSWMKKWPGRDKIQRNFLFVSRVTGAIVWLPKGTPVELGKEITDTNRGQVYKAVYTSADYLRPLDEFVEYVRG
jgi:hypothetical protein